MEAEIRRKRHFTDGNYTYAELRSEFGSDFKSEKELCDFLESHIRDFCIDFLEVEYISHKREYMIHKTSRSRGRGVRRLDFLVNVKPDNFIVIECKHPITVCEISHSLGQCLTYKSLLKNTKIDVSRTILISTKIDDVTPQVITDYNLPVEFMVMDKSRCVKFSHHGRR